MLDDDEPIASHMPPMNTARTIHQTSSWTKVTIAALLATVFSSLYVSFIYLLMALILWAWSSERHIQRCPCKIHRNTPESKHSTWSRHTATKSPVWLHHPFHLQKVCCHNFPHIFLSSLGWESCFNRPFLSDTPNDYSHPKWCSLERLEFSFHLHRFSTPQTYFSLLPSTLIFVCLLWFLSFGKFEEQWKCSEFKNAGFKKWNGNWSSWYFAQFSHAINTVLLVWLRFHLHAPAQLVHWATVTDQSTFSRLLNLLQICRFNFFYWLSTYFLSVPSKLLSFDVNPIFSTYRLGW